MKISATLLFIAIATITSAHTDCYKFKSGVQDVIIGALDPQSYTADQFCITGDYREEGESGILLFSFYLHQQEIISYYAKSERHSRSNVLFRILDGEIDPTQFVAEVRGNDLASINLRKNGPTQIGKVDLVQGQKTENYGLNCTDTNTSANPYFNFRIIFSNSTGPSLRDGTTLTLFAAYNDYFGTETPAEMVPVLACENVPTNITSVTQYNAVCTQYGGKVIIELTLISSYGLATGKISFIEEEKNLGIPQNKSFNIVCKEK